MRKKKKGYLHSTRKGHNNILIRLHKTPWPTNKQRTPVATSLKTDLVKTDWQTESGQKWTGASCCMHQNPRRDRDYSPNLNCGAIRIGIIKCTYWKVLDMKKYCKYCKQINGEINFANTYINVHLQLPKIPNGFMERLTWGNHMLRGSSLIPILQ